MEIRFWRTKRGDEVDFVLVKNRQPYPIEVKTRWQQGTPAPGVAAFCRRYPKVKLTFTISADEHEPLIEDSRTHHFLTFENTSRILERLDG